MTYQQAINQGYKLGDQTWERGYISRKTNTSTQPVLTAGGNRKGHQYVLLPSRESSQYCIRQYLIPATQA